MRKEKKVMDKIYRRPTQLGNTPRKKKNEKNRKRNVIMNFRVTPMEKEMIEARIRITGLNKGEFFINSCMNQSVTVVGNIRTFDEIKNAMSDIASRINMNPNLDELEREHAETLRIILEIIDSRFKDEN